MQVVLKKRQLKGVVVVVVQVNKNVKFVGVSKLAKFSLHSVIETVVIFTI